MVLSDRYKDILTTKRTWFVKSIDVVSTNLYTDLRSFSVLDGRAERTFRADKVNERQVELLLDYIEKKDDETFLKFVSALEKTHRHVAKVLWAAISDTEASGANSKPTSQNEHLDSSASTHPRAKFRPVEITSPIALRKHMELPDSVNQISGMSLLNDHLLVTQYGRNSISVFIISDSSRTVRKVLEPQKLRCPSGMAVVDQAQPHIVISDQGPKGLEGYLQRSRLLYLQLTSEMTVQESATQTIDAPTMQFRPGRLTVSYKGDVLWFWPDDKKILVYDHQNSCTTVNISEFLATKMPEFSPFSFLNDIAKVVPVPKENTWPATAIDTKEGLIISYPENNQVLWFSQDRRKVTHTYGDSPFFPSHLALDHRGRVLVADLNGNQVLLLEKRGSNVNSKVLLSKSEGIHQPTCLLLDEQKRYIFVGQKREDPEVLVFEYGSHGQD